MWLLQGFSVHICLQTSSLQFTQDLTTCSHFSSHFGTNSVHHVSFPLFSPLSSGMVLCHFSLLPSNTLLCLLHSVITCACHWCVLTDSVALEYVSKIYSEKDYMNLLVPGLFVVRRLREIDRANSNKHLSALNILQQPTLAAASSSMPKEVSTLLLFKSQMVFSAADQEASHRVNNLLAKTGSWIRPKVHQILQQGAQSK